MVSRRGGLALWVGVLVVLLAGCAADPRVRYVHLNQKSPDDAGLIKFRLTQTNLTLTMKRPPDQGTTDRPKPPSLEPHSSTEKVLDTSIETLFADVIAVSTPTDGADVYAIIPQDEPFVKTRLSVDFVDNTNVVKKVGTVVEDQRTKAISAVGAILTAAAMFGGLNVGAPVPEKLNLPVVIDVQEALKHSEDGWIALPRNKDLWFRITATTPGKDEGLNSAISPPSEFFEKYTRLATNVFPYSACRDGNLYIRKGQRPVPEEIPTTGDSDQVRFPFRFADSRFLQTIALPPKGSVVMHSICGVNVTSDAADTATVWSAVEEMAKQAKAVREAQIKAADAEAKAKEKAKQTAGGK